MIRRRFKRLGGTADTKVRDLGRDHRPLAFVQMPALQVFRKHPRQRIAVDVAVEFPDPRVIIFQTVRRKRLASPMAPALAEDFAGLGLTVLNPWEAA